MGTSFAEVDVAPKAANPAAGADKKGLTKVSGESIVNADGDGVKILPRHEEAVIPIEKFTQYVLNPDGDSNKAAAFQKALGYSVKNYTLLIENIRKNITKFPAVKKGDVGFGEKYQIIMELVGENGKKANVLTAWIDDNKTGDMRLINAYVDKPNKKGGG